MNIFIFWIGDIAKIENNVNKLKQLGFNVIVGPSSTEIEELKNKYVFFKNSFEQKIWSFCSDIWRLEMLANNKGMYIDTSVLIGDNFADFYNEALKYPTYLVRENYALVASCIMSSSMEKNKFFSDILDIFKTFTNPNVRTYHVITFMITKYLLNNTTFELGWEPYENESFFVDTLPKIRDENTIKKLGMGSWRKRGYNVSNVIHDGWTKYDNFWKSKTPHKDRLFEISKYENNEYTAPWLSGIRLAYDSSKLSSERKELRKMYKQIKYRIPFSRLLLWSKLYIFFTQFKIS